MLLIVEPNPAIITKLKVFMARQYLLLGPFGKNWMLIIYLNVETGGL